MSDQQPTTKVSGAVACPECEGTGFISRESDAPDADEHHGHRCDLCGGQGVITQAALAAWKEARERRGF